jgi:hypothetical protein
VPDNDSAARAALESLGLVLFVREASGALRLADRPPNWLRLLWPSLLSRGAELNLTDSPFLANFLVDAEQCWSAGNGRVQSGPWVEHDCDGQELQLQAKAFTGGGCSLLLIERLGEDFEATKSVLQKARETLIAYQRLSQPHPPEIAISLDRLRQRYPDYKTCGFLIMRFSTAKPYARIVKAIDDTAQAHGVTIVRADSHAFHADLLSNIRTYLHGCSFGIAVYDRIDVDEPNANVGLEVGYLMAMNKPVLLLKDQTLPRLQTDLAGRLYKPFDPHAPEATIPLQLSQWLQDYGIVVPSNRTPSQST